MKITVYFIALALCTVSCTKYPGIGGKATISGVVKAIYVQEGTFDTLEVSALPEERVYIIYGDASTHDDDTRTSPNGSFKFEFLNPGDYSIYSYSESLISESELMPVYKNVTISKSQDDMDIATLEVVKYVK
ncbi:MAG: hypothetical protein ACI85Q_001049 [Salibacteraceae bacterium]|jgi:hypothetical protein